MARIRSNNSKIVVKNKCGSGGDSYVDRISVNNKVLKKFDSREIQTTFHCMTCGHSEETDNLPVAMLLEVLTNVRVLIIHTELMVYKVYCPSICSY